MQCSHKRFTADLIFILFRALVGCAGVRLSYMRRRALSHASTACRAAPRKNELDLTRHLVLLVAASTLVGVGCGVCYGSQTIRAEPHPAQVPRFTALTKSELGRS